MGRVLKEVSVFSEVNLRGDTAVASEYPEERRPQKKARLKTSVERQHADVAADFAWGCGCICRDVNKEMASLVMNNSPSPVPSGPSNSSFQ